MSDASNAAAMPAEGRNRVIIEGVRPEIDCGSFPIKRVIGEKVIVEADIFTDGHDTIFCQVLYQQKDESTWHAVPMRALGNDRWRGEFRVSTLGQYRYTLRGWVDRFKTWREDLVKRLNAGQNVAIELLIGTQLVEDAARRASGDDAERLRQSAAIMSGDDPQETRIELALSEDLFAMVERYPDLRFASRYEKELAVQVDREKARFSSWYEVFPRSCSPEPDSHGTLRDCGARLPYIASMGFDVLYLPPIHPIGHTFRKGKNNSPMANPGEPGSPWAIGSEEGGHKSIHPDLGTLEDFQWLVTKAKDLGMEIALDIAFQCTPDHPYVREHPEWFRKRPDGTIQYAENPPKKYQDIYPLDLETVQWRELWEELKSVILFWVHHGVHIFRVDNPHTKAFPFWEWVIRKVKDAHPEVLFLSEAFTRPRLMYRLAKIGFSQSYTYFTWRNTKEEITDFFKELTQTEVREYFRPNLWPNTPDILPESLQIGGRPAFMVRLILAATLGASYGIYGPAFELGENTPREFGSEEYLNSEKYEIKHRDLDSPSSLKDLISRVNEIRQTNPALQSNQSLRFHNVDNPSLFCYSKTTEDLSNVIVVVVNLDFSHTQAGWLDLDINSLGLDPHRAFQAEDLLGGGRYLWHGPRNFVQLEPQSLPAHILRLRRWVRTERDFDYYL